jgi:hypothetical protein
MKLIPAFTGFAYAPEDPLARSILTYLEAGNTMPTIATLPADHWEKIGGILQKYLAGPRPGKGNHETLAQEIEAYWKTPDLIHFVPSRGSCQDAGCLLIEEAALCMKKRSKIESRHS